MDVLPHISANPHGGCALDDKQSLLWKQRLRRTSGLREPKTLGGRGTGKLDYRWIASDLFNDEATGPTFRRAKSNKPSVNMRYCFC